MNAFYCEGGTNHGPDPHPLLWAILKSLQVHTFGAREYDEAILGIGVFALIHRFGLSLTWDVEFHVGVVSGCLISK